MKISTIIRHGVTRTLTGGVKRAKAAATEDDVEARLHEEARRIERDGYVVVVAYPTSNLLRLPLIR